MLKKFSYNKFTYFSLWQAAAQMRFWPSPSAPAPLDYSIGLICSYGTGKQQLHCAQQCKRYLKQKFKPGTWPDCPVIPPATTSQYNQAAKRESSSSSSYRRWQKNEVPMRVLHGEADMGMVHGNGCGDLGTDEFTSLSKWNDIVVNLGATKNNNERQTGQNKQHARWRQRSMEYAVGRPPGVSVMEGSRKDYTIPTKANSNKLHVLPP